MTPMSTAMTNPVGTRTVVGIEVSSTEELSRRVADGFGAGH
jgi:hypothetical protein